MTWESLIKSRCMSAWWWLAPRLTLEYHNQTGISFTNARNYRHRNKIYVLTSLLKQIYSQPTFCTWIYCTVNTVCHSCCHHCEFTSRGTHEQQCCYRRFKLTSQLLQLIEWKNVTQTNQRHDMGLSSWLRLQLNRVSMSFLCEWVSSETRSGSKSSLKSSLKSRLIVNMVPGHQAQGCDYCN